MANVFAVTLFLSLGQVALHQAAETRDRSWLSKAVATLAIVGTAATIVATAVVVTAFHWRPSWGFGDSAAVAALVIVMVPALIAQQYLSQLSWALGRLTTHNLRQLAGQTAVVVGVLLVMWIKGPTWAVMAVVALGLWLGQAWSGKVVLGIEALSYRTDWTTLKQYVASGLRLHFTSIGTVVIASADIVMLGLLQGNVAVGTYQMATQLTIPLLAVPAAAASASYSEIVDLSRAVSLQRLWRRIRRVTLVMLVLGGLLMAAAPWVILLIGGREFLAATVPLRILVPGVVLATTSAMIGPYLVAFGRFRTMSLLTLVLVGANVGGNLWAIPRFGSVGAAWASTGTQLLGVVLSLLALGLVRHRNSGPI